ncbi:Cysteine desulfurase NifS [Elusimicrobium minutum Pei191]|uniref:Cysteine desulfurase n=1 Tax=Elusimicrobium minutum (strain Pei191) TaxID=445932 RepID=B2KBH2_ELUMP|nr:cysteine desulfurase NifS [Elusimicrobium minutum]ACC97994.1 Cysteine desulfurase NifS [Elusimicrobium minutum Pei191]
MKVIYLDNNATTRTAPEVVKEMLPYFSEHYGNASSMHTFGGENKKVIEDARKKMAALIGAQYPDEIIITAGGTEADNTAIMSAINSFPDKKHIITSAVEHPAVLEVFKNLQAKGYKVDYIGVDKNGRFNMDEFKAAVNENTALVSIMWANSETGTIFPIEEIAKITKEAGSVFHTDAVQAVGKIPVNVADTDINMLSFSAHKFHGPKGIGALYVKRRTRFMPFIIGGHQEKGHRAGTENVPAIAGFGKACEMALENLKNTSKTAVLRDRLEKGLLAKISHSKVNGDVENRLPNTSNISFGYIEGESILLHLNDYGICASSGSACTSGSLEPSHVLRAMCVDFNFAHGSVRFSLSDENTEQEIDFVIEKLPPIIETLRQISPFGRRS